MVGTEVRMPQMAVYYPYIHFRNPRWLKVAALYWPRMVRIVDSDYPTRNSDLVKVLQDELGFVVDHSPAAYYSRGFTLSHGPRWICGVRSRP